MKQSFTQGNELNFDIGGMHCAACSSRIERALNAMEGIESASVNLATAKACVIAKNGNLQDLTDKIKERITKLGFSAELSQQQDNSVQYENKRKKIREEKRQRLKRLIPMCVFSLALLLVSMGHMLGMPLPAWLEPGQNPSAYILVQLFLTLPVVWYGRHFYVEGISALARLAPNMDSLVAVGTGAAFLYSLYISWLGLSGDDPHMQAMNLYYESCAVLLAMIELGQFLEFTAKTRASDAMGALLSLTPESAFLMQENNTQPREIPVSAVKSGDRLLIRPGARIPVDGKVVEGNSAVDISLLTGESMPVPVEPGDELTGGSVNGEGSLVMVATAVGQNTRLARIIRLVAEAQGSKAPIARLADKVSYFFVPAVMLFALCAALCWLLFSSQPVTTALTIFVAVLVMACPCAMGLATPMSIMVGTGRGAQLGILIKNGAALEQTGKINILCVDKTGTITQGKPALLDVILPPNPAFDLDRHTLLSLASTLESRSEHPLANAIVDAAAREQCAGGEVLDLRINPGLGICGDVQFQNRNYQISIGNHAYMTLQKISVDSRTLQLLKELAGKGQTPLLCSVISAGREIVAILALADQLRPETSGVIQKLQKRGIEIVMLTGDNERTASAIAQKAGIRKIAAGLLPAQKAQYIEDLQKGGSVVGMVGDGLNDAPALAVASVGMAVGTGVDVSAEAGDIVLMQGGMEAVLTALGLSRATMRNIKQNLGWAFGYNILGLPVAAGLLFAFGGPMLSPMLAGTAMALSSFSVVTNALRLRHFGKRR